MKRGAVVLLLALAAIGTAAAAGPCSRDSLLGKWGLLGLTSSTPAYSPFGLPSLTPHTFLQTMEFAEDAFHSYVVFRLGHRDADTRLAVLEGSFEISDTCGVAITAIATNPDFPWMSLRYAARGLVTPDGRRFTGIVEWVARDAAEDPIPETSMVFSVRGGRQ